MVKQANTEQATKKRQKPLKIIAIILAVIVAIPVLGFVALRSIYVPILRSNHSLAAPGIDSLETVEIGGIDQALHFRGENTDNPVILVLHGGPGLPMLPFIHLYQYDLEKDFTIVNWDQRNAGKTFMMSDPETVRATVSEQRLLADAHEVTQHIKQRLNKDKIIILGHSWGSMLGTMLVQAYPDDYSAYIGVGQIVEPDDIERLWHERALEAAQAAGNQEDVNALEALAPYPPSTGYGTFDDQMMKVRLYQAKYDLLGPGLSVSPLSYSPYYSVGELFSFGLNASKAEYYQVGLMRFIFEYNAHDYGTEYTMPVYYIMGELDYQTPYPLAKAFFEEITAPDKQFYSIPNAGHFSMFDNTHEFNRVLLEEIGPRVR